MILTNPGALSYIYIVISVVTGVQENATKEVEEREGLARAEGGGE